MNDQDSNFNINKLTNIDCLTYIRAPFSDEEAVNEEDDDDIGRKYGS